MPGELAQEKAGGTETFAAGARAQTASGVGARIVRNTLFNAGAKGWGGLVGLCLSPYIIQRIGAERFGIWAVIGMLNGYFGLLDLGVETAFVKYISQYHAQGEHRRINQIINTGVIFYAALVLLLLLFMSLSIPAIFSFLKLSAPVGGEVRFVFWTGAVVFCLGNILIPINALQTGLQRMDLSNKVAVCMSTLTVAGTVFFLERGYGLRGLAFTNAAVFCCTALVNNALAFRIFPQLRFDLKLFSKRELTSLLNYGYKLQVSRFANLVSFQADNLLISHFLGVGLVTYYQLGTTVIQQTRQLLLLFISALIPAVSELIARKDYSRVEMLYLRGSKYLISLSLPLTVFLIVEAPLIMTCWMGEGFRLSVLVIRVLAAGYCAATVTGVASSIAAGAGRTDLDMRFGLLMASMNLALGVALIACFGLPGLLVATGASLTLSSLYFMHLFHKKVAKTSLASFLRLFRAPLLCSLLPVGALIAVNLLLQRSDFAGDRVANALFLVGGGVIFAACYIPPLLHWRYFDDYDTRLLCDRIAFLRRFLSNAA